MREALVYRNNILAGKLSLSDERVYTFRYDNTYFVDPTSPGISLTLPKTKQEYSSGTLFPFFFNTCQCTPYGSQSKGAWFAAY